MGSFHFTSVQDLVNKALKEHKKISEIVLEWEIDRSGLAKDKVLDKMRKNWKVMKEAIAEGLIKKGPSMGGLVQEAAPKVKKAIEYGTVPQDRLSKTVVRALATSEVNAAMGRVVAAPTAGSCGVIPAALSTVQEENDYSDEEIVLALFTASGVGMVIARNASVSGAEGGCQAECGSASSMAAAAVVELKGGKPQQVAEAAALALKNSLGLVCDPVGGLVEVPCIKRNAFMAVNALVAADMALSGIESFIPVDEVITAMKEIGRDMPEKFKETARGGLAVTPTAKKFIIKNEG